jgi:hypothetical protein
MQIPLIWSINGHIFTQAKSKPKRKRKRRGWKQRRKGIMSLIKKREQLKAKRVTTTNNLTFGGEAA